MTFDRIGKTLDSLGKLPLARDAYTDGQGLHEDLSKLAPANTQWQSDLATVYLEIADLENRRQARFQGVALAYYQNALKIRTTLVELDPTNIQWQVNLVEIHHKIANFYGDSGEHAQELVVNRAAQQQMARFAQQYPNDRGWLFYQLEFIFLLALSICVCNKILNHTLEVGPYQTRNDLKSPDWPTKLHLKKW